MLAATGFSTKDVEIAKRDRQIAEMQADVARIQKAADAVADRVEARQEFLASLLDGKSDPVQLAALMPGTARSEEHTSELQSIMRISYAVFCLKNKNNHIITEPLYLL